MMELENFNKQVSWHDNWASADESVWFYSDFKAWWDYNIANSIHQNHLHLLHHIHHHHLLLHYLHLHHLHRSLLCSAVVSERRR